MKKISGFALAVMLILSVCAGFAEGFVNEPPTASTETLYTVAGEAVSLTDKMLALNPKAGVGLLCPESWNAGEMLYMIRDFSNGIEIVAFPPSVTDALNALTQAEMDGMSDAQLATYVMKNLPLMRLFTSDEDAPKVVGYDVCEKIAECGEKSLYAAYQTEDRGDGFAWMTAEDHEAFMEAAQGLESLKNYAVVYPISSFDSAFQRFDAVDLDGNPVSEAIFADYDLTLVNIWATWCGPCVGEMPELAALYKNLPENVNLISLCADADAASELAREILTEAGAEFVTIVGEPSMDATLLSGIQYYPTTLFLDSEGKKVGKPLVSARSAEQYAAELQKRLELLAE